MEQKNKKNNQKMILKILFALSLSLLTSCAGVPDKPLCVELNIGKGYCVYTIRNEEFIVDDTHFYPGTNQTWFDIRNDMILMPVDTWVALKEYIIKNCKNNKKCSDKLGSWDRKIDGLDSGLNK